MSKPKIEDYAEEYLESLISTTKEYEQLREATSEFVKASNDALTSQYENDGECDPKIAQRVTDARMKLEKLGVK